MTMNLIPGVESTGSALSAEKIRLEIIAQNIANSNTTQDASGNVYKKKKSHLKSMLKFPKEECLDMLTKIFTKVFGSQMFLMIKLPVG